MHMYHSSVDIIHTHNPPLTISTTHILRVQCSRMGPPVW